MHQRDEERERNITKRVQEFEKTFDFVNSHLLKGVATMAELTKTDNVVLLPCGCLSLNPFIEISIRNNSSSSDVLNIQASININPKFESK